MHLTPIHESRLKTWIVHRLHNMSVMAWSAELLADTIRNDIVDAGILADLAIGLLRSDKRVEVLRDEVLKNLDDILEAGMN